QRLPTTCTNPDGCCDPSQPRMTGQAGADRIEVTAPGTCVDAASGNDRVFGTVTGSTVLGGAGNDLISVGQGSVVYGGAGNDVIETTGNSVVFGNDGDDEIVIPAGNNVVIPGPGKDLVELGPGDDVTIINDECEVVAGERLSGGDGHDRLISPLSRAELEARGV